jgi:hypothetical protein
MATSSNGAAIGFIIDCLAVWTRTFTRRSIRHRETKTAVFLGSVAAAAGPMKDGHADLLFDCDSNRSGGTITLAFALWPFSYNKLEREWIESSR